MTDIINLAVTFLVATTGGVLCLFRPQLVQTYVLQFYSKHPILSSLTLFKGFHATPYYVFVLRIIGAGALVISGVCLYSVIVLLR
jgi:hypothetical protein